MSRHRHLTIDCPDCRDPATGRARGVLWLGGSDYADCPTCDGRCHVELVEEPARVPGKIFLPFAPASQQLILSTRVG